METKDIIGIEPIAETVKITTNKVLEGIDSFLKIVCKPALTEVGLMARDMVRAWRLNNIASIIKKAEGRLEFNGNDLQLQANARVGLEIVEEGSKVDDDELQELWAGLFSSSCTRDGKDDSNLIFVDLLRRLSVVEARILKYACENAEKVLYPNGLILARNLPVSFETLKDIAEVDDLHRLDSEMDHLAAISLLTPNSNGFDPHDSKLSADIVPSALALNLYYKANCIGKTQNEFWGDKLKPASSEELKSIDEYVKEFF